METKRIIEATCPDCRGPLSEVKYSVDGEEIREYTCLVEHRYSARTLLNIHSDTQEQALWAAVVALEEAAVLVKAVSDEFPSPIAERLKRQGEQKLKQAAEIRAIIERLETFQTE